MNLKPLRRFCLIALLEGISYIFLLAVAMPLKYFAEMPLWVKYGGWAHGILFIAYVAMLIQVAVAYDWKMGRIVWVFLASLLPFAPFFVERRLKRQLKAGVQAA